MKKINVAIFLIIISCISLVLVSCGENSVYDCIHEYSNECDIDCNKCEQTREVSHLWVTNDADLCQHMSTCSWCGVTEGQDIEHVYTDENENQLDKCLSCGKANPNKNDPNQSSEPNESMMHIMVNGEDAYGYYHAYNGSLYAIDTNELYDDIFPFAIQSNETKFEVIINLDIPMLKGIDEEFLKVNFWGMIYSNNKGHKDDIRDNIISFEYDENTCKSIKMVIEIDEPLTSDYMMLLFVPLCFHDDYSGTLHIGIKSVEQDAEPSQKTTSRLQLTYVHGHSWNNEIPYAKLLFDDNYLSSGFGIIDVPKDITAGDIINIVHTGYIRTAETYPGQSYLVDGEVISYSFTHANVIHLEGEDFSIENVKNSYSHKTHRSYVILDRSGRYISLDKYVGDEIYLVVDTERSCVDGKTPVACMLAYNPRDLEDGIPGEMYVPPLITEQEAIELASEHFYNEFEYEPPPENFEYKAEIIEHWNTNYYHVLFSLKYIGEEDVLPDVGAVSYTYRVTKALYEIDMIIVNRH
ncbi:MAG: hypothetical protein IJW54_05960 [Clostridia bacterium]|nr:hypothetical protein [Clostridia bacterium]